MPAVVGYGVTGGDSPHESGDTTRTAADEKMDMVTHQCPGINRCSGFGGNRSKASYKILLIQLIINDVAPKICSAWILTRGIFINIMAYCQSQ